MIVTNNDVINFLEEFIPLNSQEEWDNSGFQIGDKEQKITGILLTLDITDKAVDYAIKNKLNLVISHHPLFFDGVKSIDFANYKGQLIKKVINNNIAVYSAHTNLDRYSKGVNFVLANLFGAYKLEQISDYFENEIGLFGLIDRFSLEDLKKMVEKSFPNANYKFYGKKQEIINKIAFVGGSGSFAIDLAKKLGCQLLVTGDIRHHDGQYAYENNILLLDLGHFNSEFPVLKLLKDKIEEKFKDIKLDIFKEPVFLI